METRGLVLKKESGGEIIEYLFVYGNPGWCLKLDTIEELIDYHKLMDTNRYEGALQLYMQKIHPEELPLAERIKLMESRDFKYLQAAVMQAQKVEGTILDGFRCLNMEIGMAELRCIREHGAVYINPAGGHTFSFEYSQFCRRKELVFPDFQLSDIRVKKYPAEVHWYAYIGDMQVRNGAHEKWNSPEAARNAAEAIVLGE